MTFHPFLSSIALSALLVTAGCNSAPQAKPAETAKAEVLYYKVDPATAASITGRITFAGHASAPKAIDMSEDPACGIANKGRKVYEHTLEAGKGGALADVFVYIKSGLEGKRFAPPTTAAVINQQGCTFHPHVLGVQVDQPVDITNSDMVTHNIHPMPEMNREWNHSQGPEDPPMHRRFTHAEIMIPVKCNIHAWMHGWIGVVDHPYFAVSREDGTFTITNLPPGTYTLAFWQEKLGVREQQITVAPGAHAVADLTYKGN